LTFRKEILQVRERKSSMLLFGHRQVDIKFCSEAAETRVWLSEQPSSASWETEGPFTKQ